MPIYLAMEVLIRVACENLNKNMFVFENDIFKRSRKDRALYTHKGLKSNFLMSIFVSFIEESSCG